MFSCVVFDHSYSSNVFSGWVSYDDLSDVLVLDSHAQLLSASNGLPPIDPSTVHLVLLIEDTVRNCNLDSLKPLRTSFSTPQMKLPVADYSRSVNSVVQSESSSACPSVLGSLELKKSVLSAPPDVRLNSSTSSSSLARASAFSPYSLPDQRALAKGKSQLTKSSLAPSRTALRRRGNVVKVPATPDHSKVEKLVSQKIKELSVSDVTQ